MKRSKVLKHIERPKPASPVPGEDDSAAPEGGVVARLVNDAARGDQDAWNQLVDRFASVVWAVARGHRLSDADAAHVSRTTWLRLVDNLQRLERPDQVSDWLATTARRESRRVILLAGRQMSGRHEVDLLHRHTPSEAADHLVKARGSDGRVA
jgi:DNA-directed RNA polymerase specialized sigma24 family protein